MRKDEKEYEGVGFLHCRGWFKNPDDREKISNIFDMYYDLIEALEIQINRSLGRLCPRLF